MLCIILFIIAGVPCSPPTGMPVHRMYLDYSDQIPSYCSTLRVKTVLLVLIFIRNIKHCLYRCINSSFSTKNINNNIFSLDFLSVKLIVL